MRTFRPIRRSSTSTEEIKRLDTTIPLVSTGSVSRRITGRGALATEMPGHDTELVVLSANLIMVQYMGQLLFVSYRDRALISNFHKQAQDSHNP